MSFLLSSYRDSGTKTPQHREMETIKSQNCDAKAFFERAKNRDIEIPRPKSRSIKFLGNSDSYAL